MDIKVFLKNNAVLLAGDVVTISLVTILGFVSHGTLETAGIRILATFIPLLISWFLLSPHLGVYDQSKICVPSQLWRPIWAMIIAAPFASWLRGVWLNSPILPVFVFVLGGVSVLGILLWRLSYYLIQCRKR
jgi:hypothetical protein